MRQSEMPLPGVDPARLDRQSFGSILSTDPLVTVSKRSHFHDSRAGIGPLAAALRPELPSLHFLFLAWSHESPDAAATAARDIAAAFSPFPKARVVVMANTPAEAGALRKAGLLVELCNELLAVDDRRFALAAPDAAFPPCAAVYVAALEPYKRHDLARDLDGLRLLYWRPSAADLDRTRRLLPGADFANHRLGGGPHRLIHGRQYNAALQSARVALCLSETEGPMRASIEYALLGLPIVSTTATGGRIEFAGDRFMRVVPPDPAAIAQAVAKVAARPPSPADIRANALACLSAERARLRAIAAQHGEAALGDPIPDVVQSDPRDWGLWRTRSMREILAKAARPQDP